MPRIETAAGYVLRHDAELAPFTTFRVPARAACLAEIHDPASLPALLSSAMARDHGALVLGGGSNVLFTGDFPGLVLRMENRGRRILATHSGALDLRVAAGENWDALVRHSLAEGLAGLENLVLIPGSVGAAPIQNIGAYGTELSEFVLAVEAWDREEGEFLRLGREDCDFAYRDSLFRRTPGRYVITAVELRLPREHALRLDYPGVAEELTAMEVKRPTAVDVARAVERLRRRKLPDPAKIGNAGSFFKNPIVPQAQAVALAAAHRGLPVYPLGADGLAKLSAAWLIESCECKGWRQGGAGVSEKHALVLVNHGGATGAEIRALAERIRAAVSDRFGVMLEPEPLIV